VARLAGRKNFGLEVRQELRVRRRSIPAPGFPIRADGCRTQ
jgi:hypothetical protein